jgi:hypothetical protein
MQPLTTTTAAVPLTGGADGLAQLTAGLRWRKVDPLDNDEVKAEKNSRPASLRNSRGFDNRGSRHQHSTKRRFRRRLRRRPAFPDPCLPPNPPPAVPRPPSVGICRRFFQVISIGSIVGLIQQCEKLGDRIALLIRRSRLPATTKLALARCARGAAGSIRSMPRSITRGYA